MDHLEILSTMLTWLPKKPAGPSGWASLNCQMCVTNGEPTPDKRQRGGLRINPDSFTYKCFRCRFKATWKPGIDLNRDSRLWSLLQVHGMPFDDIQKLSFQIYKTNREQTTSSEKKDLSNLAAKELTFSDKDLPPGSKSFSQLATENCAHPDFIRALTYVHSRNLLDLYEFYWAPGHKKQQGKRVIIPFRHHDKIVGWTARLSEDNPSKSMRKYNSEQQLGYLFNNHLLEDETRETIILVEGPMDGIVLDGVAYLGQSPTPDQIRWINNSGKQIILLPDLDKAGLNLKDPNSAINVALTNKWKVSFPVWAGQVKDAAEALLKYGRLFTVYSILDAASNSEIKIKTMAKYYTNKIR